MSNVRVMCVVTDEWAADGAESAAALLLERGVVPRVAVERTGEDPEAGSQVRLWLDVRGMSIERVGTRVRRVLEETGVRNARMGVSAVPAAAFAAAWSMDRAGESGQSEGSRGHVAAPVHRTEEARRRVIDGRRDGGGALRVVPRGGERKFLAPLALEAIEVDAALIELMTGVGIECCGELAALPREAVEVRFGGSVVESWRRARADDPRVPFADSPSSLPSASLDFIDYVVTDPERLIWIANALLGNLCAALAERGMHARRLWLALPLANRDVWRRTLRAARPTASRTVWLRRIRFELERLSVPDAVAGIAIGIDATEPASSVQGDLFDPGFATAASVEAALERLLEAQGTVVVQPESTRHGLPERRTTLSPVEPEALLREDSTAASSNGQPAGLTLQLLPDPRRVLVETLPRRDHGVPIRYRDGDWREILTVTGPERISGGQWDEPFAREYWRIVSADGSLVWIYREGRTGEWFLHGWWD